MLRRCQSLLNSYAQRCHSNGCVTHPWKGQRSCVSTRTAQHPFPWVVSNQTAGIRHGFKKFRSVWLMDEQTMLFGKEANRVLGHGARSLDMRPDGYVRVRDMLNMPSFQTMSLETFLHFIKSNPKHFQLAYQPDGEDLDMKIPWVRAVRLTIPGVDLGLRRILRHNSFPTAVYHTSLTNWERTRTHGILSTADGFIRLLTESNPNVVEETVSLTHPSERLVAEGTRNFSRCIICVYISIQKALSSGINLYFSRKGDEVLTKGDRNGVISPTLFTKAIKVETERQVLMEERSSQRE